MELILVRHAEPTDAPLDPPLSQRGRVQARAIAAWLTRDELDVIVSSPARRVRETAAVTAGRAGLEVFVEERLREAQPAAEPYRALEGIRAFDPDAYRDRVAAYRDGSRWAGLAERVHPALDEWASKVRGGRLAVFAHGSTINVFAARVLGLENAAFLEASFGSGHRFLISSGGVRSVRSLNETAYLSGELLG
jgi:probable phosphoglycerate mutase